MRPSTIQGTSTTLHIALILWHVFRRSHERIATEAFNRVLYTVVLAALAECRAHIARHVVVFLEAIS